MKIRYIMLLAAVVTLSGCNEWQNSKAVENAKTNFQYACENSGGKYDGSLCECENEKELNPWKESNKCDYGVVCVLNSGKQSICAGRTGDSFEKMCVSSGGEIDHDDNNEIRCRCDKLCDDGVVCENGVCAGWTGASFEKMCVSSGGEIVNGNCRCADSPSVCDKGVVCKLFNTKSICANYLDYCSKNDLTDNEDNIASKITKTECFDNVIYSCAHVEQGNNSEYIMIQSDKCDNGCDDNKCTDECLDGSSRRCSDNHYFVNYCDGGFKKSEFCLYGCDELSKECVKADCINENEIRCSESGELQKCRNGRWEKEEYCQNSCMMENGEAKCGECKNESTRCIYKEFNDKEDIKNIGIPQTCINGKWNNNSNDPNEIEFCPGHNSCTITKAEDGTETSTCGQCLNDFNVGCFNNPDNNDIGSLITCKNGIMDLTNAQICAGEVSCKQKGECKIDTDKCCKDDVSQCEQSNKEKRERACLNCLCGADYCKENQYCDVIKNECADNIREINDDIDIDKCCGNDVSKCSVLNADVRQDKCEKHKCGDTYCKIGYCNEVNGKCINKVEKCSSDNEECCKNEEIQCGEFELNNKYCIFYTDSTVESECINAFLSLEIDSSDINSSDIRYWTCGDCKNGPTSIQLDDCRGNVGQDLCLPTFLKTVDVSVFSACLVEEQPSKCIRCKLAQEFEGNDYESCMKNSNAISFDHCAYANCLLTDCSDVNRQCLLDDFNTFTDNQKRYHVSMLPIYPSIDYFNNEIDKLFKIKQQVYDDHACGSYTEIQGGLEIPMGKCSEETSEECINCLISEYKDFIQDYTTVPNPCIKEDKTIDDRCTKCLGDNPCYQTNECTPAEAKKMMDELWTELDEWFKAHFNGTKDKPGIIATCNAKQEECSQIKEKDNACKSTDSISSINALFQTPQCELNDTTQTSYCYYCRDGKLKNEKPQPNEIDGDKCHLLSW